MQPANGLAPGDPQEAVARVAAERRRRSLLSNRSRLSWEELEDCYSQATLELLARVQLRGPFSSGEHVAHALEQRFRSRIQDRHRARTGRSPGAAALAQALPLAACDTSRGAQTIVDRRADVEGIVLQREELARIARHTLALTHDQRLLLRSQIVGEPSSSFCAEHGWSREKYRKVGQRARARLTALLCSERSVPFVPARRISGHGPAYVTPSPTA